MSRSDSRQVRELDGDEAELAAPALLLLRPRYGDEAALLSAVRAQCGEGYRLLGAFVPGERVAVSVAGFRVSHYLAFGRTLYVDDLSTLDAHRGAGHARAVLERLESVARAEGCDELHLDSGLGERRAAAHGLYYASGLHVSAFHFHKDLRRAAGNG